MTSEHSLLGPRPKMINESPLKILIPTIYVGAVIGRGGASIREMTKTTGARINVLRNWPHLSEKIVCIIGKPQNCSAACKRILQLCQAESKSCGGGTEVCLRLFAPDSQVGRVIGRERKNIKKIMHQTQTKIHVSNQIQRDGGRDTGGYSSSSSSDERIITIRGSTEAMSQAESLISSKLRIHPDNYYHQNDSNYYSNTNSNTELYNVASNLRHNIPPMEGQFYPTSMAAHTRPISVPPPYWPMDSSI